MTEIAPLSDTGAWILAYFRQIYQSRVEVGREGLYHVPLSEEDLCVERLHLAYSRDAVHWTALNGNQPIPLDPAGRWRLRDPFVQRGPHGNFHLVATGGDTAHDILYARSKDLISWEGPRSVPVVSDVPTARNAWAPEWIYDHERGDYFVHWSSSSGSHGWDDSRIWCARTRDFASFSQPVVLFDPSYTVIDSTVVAHEGAFYLLFKDERFGYEHGEHRHIKVATSPALDGPYTVVTGAVTPSITEGPAVLRRPDASGWYLLYDHCMDDRYGLSASDDLLNWEAVGSEFPPNARHGSVVRVSETELSALLRQFGG